MQFLNLGLFEDVVVAVVGGNLPDLILTLDDVIFLYFLFLEQKQLSVHCF